MGLGAQLIGWPEGFVQKFADEGFFVITFDNRDCGLSSKTEGEPEDSGELLVRAAIGEEVVQKYSLSDMALDSVSLLKNLGFEAAHIVGASMGGMIAQTIAIEHPSNALSLTSIMSATGNPEEFTPTEEAMNALLTPPEDERDQIIEANVNASKTLAGPHWDEDYAREQAIRNYERSFHPKGIGFQIGAIAMSGDRTEKLSSLEIPTLVIHGSVDPLLPLHCGISTAEAIPEAELLIFEDMGHDLPEELWEQVVTKIKLLSGEA
tara:strand:- start:302 stop:1093 length:792 start_codon:yes stop_codon:yes gene_type:complete